MSNVQKRIKALEDQIIDLTRIEDGYIEQLKIASEIIESQQHDLDCALKDLQRTTSLLYILSI